MRAAESLDRVRVLNSEEMEHTVRRIAYEILDKYGDRSMAFVGIHTRGVVFADRVYQVVSEKNSCLSKGTLDITLYRDDQDNLGAAAAVKSSAIPFDVQGSFIILFDDVLYTGRTVRAALDDLIDYGRPARIELAVLIDRGNRELPICPNYTGRYVRTEARERVRVRFRETDSEDAVYLLREGAEE